MEITVEVYDTGGEINQIDHVSLDSDFEVLYVYPLPEWASTVMIIHLEYTEGTNVISTNQAFIAYS